MIPTTSDLIQLLNEVLVACDKNPEKPYESIFSKGEANGYINQSVNEINLQTENSVIWMEFLFKLLMLDSGIRECLEKKQQVILSLVRYPVPPNNTQFEQIHLGLIRFFYHYYGTEVTGCIEAVEPLPITEEAILNGAQKSLDMPPEYQKLLTLSENNFPHKPNAFIAQKCLLSQLQDLQKKLHITEEKNQKITENNMELQKKNFDLHHQIADLNKENTVLKKGISELTSSISDLSNVNQSLQKRCEGLQQGSFEELHVASEQLKSFAEISSAGFCTADGIGSHQARVGKSASFTITVNCRDGHRLRRGGDPFHAYIHGPSTSTQASVKDNNDGTYLIEYTPTQQGIHMVSVILRGKHIQDSPFQVNVWRDYKRIDNPKLIIGSKGKDEYQFNFPYGLAVDRHNHIIITDTDNHRIQIFDQNGTLIRKFGILGEDIGELNYPYDAGVDENDNIIVADWGNHRVQVFDRNGQVVALFGSKGVSEGFFERPRFISVTLDGCIYVVDQNCIQMFDSEYKFTMRFGSEGAHGVAVDSNGRIIVSYPNKNVIHIYNPEGEFIHEFGCKGISEGEFQEPWGLLVDAGDNIIVADKKNHRIQVFDSNGKFFSAFGSFGSKPGCFNHPLGVAINTKGDLIVADHLNHRAQMF